jgi:hypothetical protein
MANVAPRSKFNTFQQQVTGLQSQKDSPLSNALLGTTDITVGSTNQAAKQAKDKQSEVSDKTSTGTLSGMVDPKSYTTTVTPSGVTQTPSGTYTPSGVPTPTAAKTLDDLKASGGASGIAASHSSNVSTAVDNIKNSVSQSGQDAINSIIASADGDSSAIAAALGIGSEVSNYINNFGKTVVDPITGEGSAGRTIGDIGRTSDSEFMAGELANTLGTTSSQDTSALLAALGLSGAMGEYDPRLAALTQQVYHGDLQQARAEGAARSADLTQAEDLRTAAKGNLFKEYGDASTRLDEVKGKKEKEVEDAREAAIADVNKQVEEIKKNVDAGADIDAGAVFQEGIKNVFNSYVVPQEKIATTRDDDLTRWMNGINALVDYLRKEDPNNPNIPTYDNTARQYQNILAARRESANPTPAKVKADSKHGGGKQDPTEIPSKPNVRSDSQDADVARQWVSNEEHRALDENEKNALEKAILGEGPEKVSVRTVSRPNRSDRTSSDGGGGRSTNKGLRRNEY